MLVNKSIGKRWVGRDKSNSWHMENKRIWDMQGNDNLHGREIDCENKDCADLVRIVFIDDILLCESAE
jgi:hypothetical protein